jgi:RNA polymerase sigma-70 factor (ECF subfamily)
MSEEDEDEALMARIAAGEHRAFRALMTRHMPRVMRLAQSMTGSAAEADDIAQEAFLRVWRKAESFDPAFARFTTWMHRIVVNLVIDRARRPRPAPIELAEDIPATDTDALTQVIDDEQRQAVARALETMPANQRMAVALFHFEGLSGREGAQAMNLTEKAFESLLTRGRKTLRQQVLAAIGQKEDMT